MTLLDRLRDYQALKQLVFKIGRNLENELQDHQVRWEEVALIDKIVAIRLLRNSSGMSLSMCHEIVNKWIKQRM